MPTIPVTAQVSLDDLIGALSQLSPNDFEDLVSRLIEIRTKRRAPRLSASETQLFAVINQGLTEDQQRRFDELTAKRDAETLTPQEHAELLQLTDRIEELEAARAGAMVELAQQWGMSLPTLSQRLGIQALKHD